MADAMSDENIKTWVRARPLNARENRVCLTVNPESNSVTIAARPQPKTFTPDGVFGSDTPQVEVFEKAAKSIASQALKGFNGTIFAYGQTGSGKTHTILGSDVASGGLGGDASSKDETRGLLPRVLEYIFETIRIKELKEGEHTVKHLCKCSFIEVRRA